MGLKLYSASVSWRSPFLAREWVGSVWKLGRVWKLGSRWHRWAIANNYPELLSFPEENSDDKGRIRAREMCWRPPLSYWLRTGVGIRKTIMKLLRVKKPFMPEKLSLTRQGGQSRAYYGEWFRSPRILGFIAENSHLLSDVMSESAVGSVIEEQKTRGNRTAAIAFLLNLIFWKINLNEVYGDTITPATDAPLYSRASMNRPGSSHPASVTTRLALKREQSKPAHVAPVG